MNPARIALSRHEGCLSDLALDRRLANELDAAEERDAKAHLATCARCEARLAERARAKADFAANAPPLLFPSPRRAWLGGAAAVLAAAAALLLLMRSSPEPTPKPETRTKGEGTHLDFYVSHEGNVRHGMLSELVAPGDGIRFVVHANEMRYLAVLSVDGAKHVSPYYPHGDDAVRIEPGANIALPESTTLDDVLGDETIYGVFCPAPFAIAPLRKALEAAPDALPARPGCTVDVLHLRKEAPSPR